VLLFRCLRVKCVEPLVATGVVALMDIVLGWDFCSDVAMRALVLSAIEPHPASTYPARQPDVFRVQAWWSVFRSDPDGGLSAALQTVIPTRKFEHRVIAT